MDESPTPMDADLTLNATLARLQQKSTVFSAEGRSTHTRVIWGIYLGTQMRSMIPRQFRTLSIQKSSTLKGILGRVEFDIVW